MTAPQDPPAGTAPARRPAPQLFSIFAIIAGVLAFALHPLIFGLLGVVLAVVSQRRGESRWNIALGVVVAGTVLGLVVWAIAIANR